MKEAETLGSAARLTFAPLCEPPASLVHLPPRPPATTATAQTTTAPAPTTTAGTCVLPNVRFNVLPGVLLRHRFVVWRGALPVLVLVS